MSCPMKKQHEGMNIEKLKFSSCVTILVVIIVKIEKFRSQCFDTTFTILVVIIVYTTFVDFISLLMTSLQLYLQNESKHYN